jgi:hypothetical protein
MAAKLFRVLMAIAVPSLEYPTLAIADPPPAAEPAARPKTTEEKIQALTDEVAELKALVLSLREQVSKSTPAAAPAAPAAQVAAEQKSAMVPAAPAIAATSAGSLGAGLLEGTTFNAMLDTYYEYNLNDSLGRVNDLRAYDVSSNSFSLNQADLMIERAPDPEAGRRAGLRLDFQFGQATSTLQGNPANELRPDVYRNIYQAYGTYVFPLAKGLVVDFGKWSSSLGLEGNYTKDQLNYSRSFWFDYLPFYHTGLRAKLKVNDWLALNLWITNGTNQTEAFNNYKDQLFGFVLTPSTSLTWTFNYYQGQEHPDVTYLSSATAAQQNLPSQQGTYILPIVDAPDGHLQIVDSYVTWQALAALTLSAEVDYVEQRLYSYSSPARVEGGALYAGYQISPQFAMAVRGEYLADLGGLFSGVTQYLKEGTFSLDYRPVDGFMIRGEYRRDQSNQRYFIGRTLGLLEAAQPTIGFGVLWWFGGKQGAW